MNNSDENGFINGESGRFFPRRDSTYVSRRCLEAKEDNTPLTLLSFCHSETCTITIIATGNTFRVEHYRMGRVNLIISNFRSHVYRWIRTSSSAFSFSGRGGFFPQGPTTRRKSVLHPRFNQNGPEMFGMTRPTSQTPSTVSPFRKSTPSVG